MEVVTFAFDVDNTLISEDGNAIENIRTLMCILKTNFQNVRIVMWSGSGEAYAVQRARQIHVGHWIDKYAFKGSVPVDIVFDDVDTTSLGKFNVILKDAGGSA